MTTRDDATASSPPNDCGRCTLHETLGAPAAIERREFVRAAGLALASLGLLGASAGTLRAMAPRVGRPERAAPGDRADERRYAIPAADGVAIDKDNSVIVARADGKVFAFALACPHQNTALRWNGDDHEFQCPKHKSHYRADGSFIEGRATRNMDRLVVRRDGAALVVDVDNLIQEDEHPEAWSRAFIAV